MATTFVAYDPANGTISGREEADHTAAYLAAFEAAFGGGLHFERLASGHMAILDAAGVECFLAYSLADDDAVAQAECLAEAHRACRDSRQQPLAVVEIERDAAGAVVRVDDGSSVDDEDRAAQLAYWTVRLG